MKHNRWVVFYALAVSSLFLLALVLSGVVENKVPKLSVPRSSMDVMGIKYEALCDFEKYSLVAQSSVKEAGDGYVRITGGDLTGEDSIYIQKAKKLCNDIGYARKFNKIKISESEWEYDIRFGLFHDSGVSYKVVYHDGDWRYVLVVDEN